MLAAVGWSQLIHTTFEVRAVNPVTILFDKTETQVFQHLAQVRQLLEQKVTLKSVFPDNQYGPWCWAWENSKAEIGMAVGYISCFLLPPGMAPGSAPLPAGIESFFAQMCSVPPWATVTIHRIWALAPLSPSVLEILSLASLYPPTLSGWAHVEPGCCLTELE